MAALIGEAFLGWLVTDGYAAYRDHPRRQRCLAHLIRKGLALAGGLYGDAGFGRDLVRNLRRLIERVRDGEADSKAVRRLMDAIKWSCQCNRHEIEQKVRDLANEILNDWDAVIAFVYDPRLPPTNNDAERALRHAVIARRISYGTRTDEGSRLYAAGLSIISNPPQGVASTPGPTPAISSPPARTGAATHFVSIKIAHVTGGTLAPNPTHLYGDVFGRNLNVLRIILLFRLGGYRRLTVPVLLTGRAAGFVRSVLSFVTYFTLLLTHRAAFQAAAVSSVAHGFVPLPSLYRSPQGGQRGRQIGAPQCAR